MEADRLRSLQRELRHGRGRNLLMPDRRSLLHQPATEIIRSIAHGEMSAADVVRLHLEQIDRLQPELNAFVDIRGEAALAEARAQDETATRGVPRGPLGGLPVTVKSAIEVAGLRCETGSPSRKDIVAESDAVVVQRLKAAGAIVLGTTNVAEMLMGYESDNPLHGRTSNPWNLELTPGGSSGGESAAIAAGCSAGGIGSDGGGSIRVPAHFTGICGLKPTPGRIPGTGHQPPCLGPFCLIGVVGPMARTIQDVYELFRVVAGWEPGDPMAAPVPIKGLDEALDGKPLRIGFFEDDGRTKVTAETRAAVQTAARAAARAGHPVEPFRPEGLDRARELWDVFFAEVGLLLLGETLEGAEKALPILKAFLKGDAPLPPLTSTGFIHAWIDRDEVRANLLRQMDTHQVLICPVAAIPAFRHGERSWKVDGVDVGYLDAMTYTHWFNILGNPAVVVPVGKSADGLPIGVQVVGRPFEEEVILAVAAQIEREVGGYARPPIS
jgi:Asp-tRNA(Asn)/Glu-tRNA(Gln) amidotransferase A subunit family amidase